MRKKVLAVMMGMALAAGMLAGCGGTDTGAAAAEAAEIGGVNFKWMAPEKKDDAQQIEQINNAVADGAQAIMIAPNGPEAAFGTDGVRAGEIAAEEMLKALEEAGITSGKIGIVNFSASNQNAKNREEGCAIGVGNAIKGADTDIIGVGFDKSNALLSMVEDGSLICTIAQNPDVMGREGMKAAVAAIRGEMIEVTQMDTGVSVITKDGVEQK